MVQHYIHTHIQEGVWRVSHQSSSLFSCHEHLKKWLFLCVMHFVSLFIHHFFNAFDKKHLYLGNLVFRRFCLKKMLSCQNVKTDEARLAPCSVQRQLMDQSEQSRYIKAILWLVDKTEARLALARVQLYSAVVYTVVLAQSVQRMDYSINVQQYNWSEHSVCTTSVCLGSVKSYSSVHCTVVYTQEQSSCTRCVQ